MGCGSSVNKVSVASTIAVAPADNNNKLKMAPHPPATKAGERRGSRPGSGRRLPVQPLAPKPLLAKRRSGGSKAWGSQDSLGGRSVTSVSSPRGGSATSKASKHSGDSGFSAGAGSENAHIITESSDPNRVKNIEEEFESPRGLDLGVVGQACQQRLSAKDKDRMEEQRVMATLRQEGLIARPVSRAAKFGVSFDIVTEDGERAQRRPPMRLARLELTKKERRPLTDAEIEEKMERAEARRKERESQKLAKIQAVTMKSDVQNALDSFAQRQAGLLEDTRSKEEVAISNREKKLQEKREKLRLRQERAEAVRRRKQLAQVQQLGEEDAVDADQLAEMTRQRVTEDTPVGPRAAELH